MDFKGAHPVHATPQEIQEIQPYWEINNHAPLSKKTLKNTCGFNVLWLTFKDMFFVGWTTEASKLHFQKVQCGDARNIGIADLTISKHSASDGNNIKEAQKAVASVWGCRVDLIGFVWIVFRNKPRPPWNYQQLSSLLGPWKNLTLYWLVVDATCAWYQKRTDWQLASSVRYLKISICWIWSTSNQPNSMIWWSWHHFVQKAPWPCWLPSSQPFSWVKARPGIYQQFASITWCFAGKGGERLGFGLQDGGWWVLNQLQPWLWSQLVGYEVLSSLRLTLLGNVFLEMWSKCWLQLTVDFRGYEGTTEWYCTFLHVYRFIVFVMWWFQTFFHFLPNLAEDDPIWTKGGDCPPSCMCAMRSEVLIVVFRRMRSLPT